MKRDAGAPMKRNEQVEPHDGSEPVRAPAVSQCEDCGMIKSDVREVVLDDPEHQDDCYRMNLCEECERKRW